MSTKTRPMRTPPLLSKLKWHKDPEKHEQWRRKHAKLRDEVWRGDSPVIIDTMEKVFGVEPEEVRGDVYPRRPPRKKPRHVVFATIFRPKGNS